MIRSLCLIQTSQLRHRKFPLVITIRRHQEEECQNECATNLTCKPKRRNYIVLTMYRPHRVPLLFQLVYQHYIRYHYYLYSHISTWVFYIILIIIWKLWPMLKICCQIFRHFQLNFQINKWYHRPLFCIHSIFETEGNSFSELYIGGGGLFQSYIWKLTWLPITFLIVWKF